MKITVERTPKSEAVLEVELDWDEVEKASERAYRKLAQKYTVPGFRRGHAPRTMLERMLGKDTLYQEGIDDLINETYKKAIADHHLTPVGEAEVEALAVEPGQPYHFKATVPVLSPVELGDYRSIHLDPPDTTVSDEDVNRVLDTYREKQAIWVPVERPAQADDKMTVHLLLKVGERTISDLKDHEFTLTTDERPGLFAGLDAELIGASEGETKTFTLTIPEDYVNKDLAGKEANYTISIRAIKHKELPELDDELAKGAGAYTTLAGLHESIHEELLKNRQAQATRDLESRVLEAATDQASVEIHQVMIDEEAEHLYDQMGRMLQQQGMSMDQFLMMSQKKPDEYKKELAPEATRHVKTELVLEAIADKEGISVSTGELQELLDLYNQLGATKTPRLNQLSITARKRLEDSIKRDKARKFLIDHATTPADLTDGGVPPVSQPAGAGGVAETSEPTPAELQAESEASI